MKISIDTRTLQPGDIFIPIKGPNYDGHQFIQDALNKGAQKILDVDLATFTASYRQKLTCPIIAITGSAGKTTMKDMLFFVLSQKYKVHRSKENQNNEVGVPVNLLQADADTEIVILELAMRHKGDIAALTKIVRPTHVVITGIGKTHIEILKTQRNIALAKSEIFKKPLKWEKYQRFAFINYSSGYYELLKTKALHAGYQLLPYESQDAIDWNLTACYGVGRHFGLSDDQIKAGIDAYQPSSHRQRKLQLLNTVTVIDDTYNANPDGVRYALNSLKRFTGRKLFVFGDMLELGDHAQKEHQKIVDIALDCGISIMFTFGPISKMIQSDQLAIHSFLDKTALISLLKAELKPGDAILVKGSRGMKMEEVVDALEAANVH